MGLIEQISLLTSGIDVAFSQQGDLPGSCAEAVAGTEKLCDAIAEDAEATSKRSFHVAPNLKQMDVLLDRLQVALESLSLRTDPLKQKFDNHGKKYDAFVCDLRRMEQSLPNCEDFLQKLQALLAIPGSDQRCQELAANDNSCFSPLRHCV